MNYCSRLGKTLDNSKIKDRTNVLCQFIFNNYASDKGNFAFFVDVNLTDKHDDYIDLFKFKNTDENIQKLTKTIIENPSKYAVDDICGLKKYLKNVACFNQNLENYTELFYKHINKNQFKIICREAYKNYYDYSLGNYFNKIDLDEMKFDQEHYFIDCKKIHVDVCQSLSSDTSLRCLINNKNNSELLVVPKLKLLNVLKVLDQNSTQYDVFSNKQNLSNNLIMSNEEIVDACQKISQQNEMQEHEKLSILKNQYPNLNPINDVDDKEKSPLIDNVRKFLKNAMPNEIFSVRKSREHKNICIVTTGNPYLKYKLDKCLETFKNTDFQKVFGNVNYLTVFDISMMQKVLNLEKNHNTFNFNPDYLIIKPDQKLEGGLELVKELNHYQGVVKIDGENLLAVPKQFFNNNLHQKNLLIREGILNSKIYETLLDALSNKNELRSKQSNDNQDHKDSVVKR